MSNLNTVAVWGDESQTDVAYLAVPTVRALLATVTAQRANADEGREVAALEVGAALLRGLLLDTTPRRTHLAVPGVLLSLLLGAGRAVGLAAEAALSEAGW